jgi:hypothetical protein
VIETLGDFFRVWRQRRGRANDHRSVAALVERRFDPAEAYITDWR